MSVNDFELRLAGYLQEKSAYFISLLKSRIDLFSVGVVHSGELRRPSPSSIRAARSLPKRSCLA